VWAVLATFVGTYVLIAARRLHVVPIGRPGAALAGATGMVALSVVSPRWGLSPSEAFAAVEPNTIGLLLGMILLAASLGEAGFFELGADWLLARKLSPSTLLHVVTLTAGVLSALLVGNLTLIGSVANIIVVEATSAENEIGFFRYLKVGVPVTLVSSLAAGVLLLVTTQP
jgi:Na+/H+ antiporter NhaD/arsenite permease-like protein